MKWADYCISKLSFVTNQKKILEVQIHPDNGDTIGSGSIRDRSWLIQQSNKGKTFCCIQRTIKGKWNKICDFRFENGAFKCNATLPQVLTRRKSFISYYHKDDEGYRDAFENLTDDLIVNKSVHDNDIDCDSKDEYIKQLIQKEYLKDTTVLIVLISNKTKCRKHIDWEISGALNYKVGDSYAGILGLILPNHPDYGTSKGTYDLMPARLADNFKSGYAIIRDWTNDTEKIQSYIELAFNNRTAKSEKRTNSRPQMQRNTCE
ncbi:TIR domain-containing protein [Fulvivirgaceae bacterium BMA12]|uniref:TIR domain-containing protein n=1 Tax=Agaribacillus aureus TaxID=3051825 RepID=A0ABT8L477_9BACT|nr:TIR domain-containing protein [Fulvivirgaceae bacterium BMA12]